MSKFRKKKKGLPALSTASLPDIVFMLLFFFMVTTKMRETSLLVDTPRLPSATEVKKLENKSLVSTIYVGKAKDATCKGEGRRLVNGEGIDLEQREGKLWKGNEPTTLK